MNHAEIARAFSNGDFERTYAFISDTAVWTVIGESKFVGKQAIIDNCEKVASYFKSVDTDFRTLNVIADENKVAIEGTAAFTRDGKQVSFVSACDVYEFSNQGLIESIRSYCIQS
jgi:ketosteroid isomerase-like protein